MKVRDLFPALLLVGATVGPAVAQEAAMTNAELTALLAGGKTLTLGGEGQGYLGSLTLGADGTGEGSATTDAGKTIDIAGTWSIRGDQFCRVWEGLNDGAEVCETWLKTSDTSVRVMNGDEQIGVNSW
jgi:hypothetical protein